MSIVHISTTCSFALETLMKQVLFKARFKKRKFFTLSDLRSALFQSLWTVNSAQHLPHINSCLDALSGAKYFWTWAVRITRYQ